MLRAIDRFRDILCCPKHSTTLLADKIQNCVIVVFFVHNAGVCISTLDLNFDDSLFTGHYSIVMLCCVQVIDGSIMCVHGGLSPMIRTISQVNATPLSYV